MRLPQIFLVLIIGLILAGAKCDDSQLDQTDEYAENGKTFVQVVGNMVPASKPITGIIVGILGLVTTVTAAMRGKKHKKRADNYSESIEAARMEGSDKGKIDVADLEKALDKDTKAHYNSTGTTRF